LAALNLLDEENEEEEEEEEEEESDSDLSEEDKPVLAGEKAVTKVMTFNDDFTQGKFGDVVTVTTSVGDLQSESDDSGSDLEPSDDEDADAEDKPKHPAFHRKKKFDKEKHLTLFQRIQLQRKGKALPSKRSKLKEARTARKAMLGGKKGKHGGEVAGKKRGADDAEGGGSGGSAFSKLNKKLKMKRSQGGGNKRNKKR
jgi:ribosomal RNA-processing protein 17